MITSDRFYRRVLRPPVDWVMDRIYRMDTRHPVRYDDLGFSEDRGVYYGAPRPCAQATCSSTWDVARAES